MRARMVDVSPPDPPTAPSMWARGRDLSRCSVIFFFFAIYSFGRDNLARTAALVLGLCRFQTVDDAPLQGEHRKKPGMIMLGRLGLALQNLQSQLKRVDATEQAVPCLGTEIGQTIGHHLFLLIFGSSSAISSHSLPSPWMT